MFLPSGTDSPSYATASAQERKRGRFCLLYREQERPLRCRPITGRIRRRACGFPVPGGHRFPSLCFDRCATALETHPPPVVSCAHLPATSTDYPAASDGGGRRFPGLPSWGQSAIVLSRNAISRELTSLIP